MCALLKYVIMNLKALRAKIEIHVPHGKTLAKKKSKDHGAWDSQKIPAHVEKQKKKIEGWFDRYRLDCGGISKWLNRRHPITHLGTLGTGNHFIELCLDEKDHVWIMLHSGSRGIGNSVGTHFINKAKEEMGGPVISPSQQRLCIPDQQSENLQGLLQGGFHLSAIRTIESGDDADLSGGTDGQSLQELLSDGIRH